MAGLLDARIVRVVRPHKYESAHPIRLPSDYSRCFAHITTAFFSNIYVGVSSHAGRSANEFVDKERPPPHYCAKEFARPLNTL